MEILADVEPRGRQMRVEDFEGIDLLCHRVSTVIDDNVNAWDLILQSAQKALVTLIANQNRGLIVLELPAIRMHVHAKESRFVAKVLLPHLKGPTMIDADFKQMHICAPITGKEAIINVEIVRPFVYEVSRIVLKVLSEIIHTE